MHVVKLINNWPIHLLFFYLVTNSAGDSHRQKIKRYIPMTNPWDGCCVYFCSCCRCCCWRRVSSLTSKCWSLLQYQSLQTAARPTRSLPSGQPTERPAEGRTPAEDRTRRQGCRRRRRRHRCYSDHGRQARRRRDVQQTRHQSIVGADMRRIGNSWYGRRARALASLSWSCRSRDRSRDTWCRIICIRMYILSIEYTESLACIPLFKLWVSKIFLRRRYSFYMP